jgi:hypothetical protein
VYPSVGLANADPPISLDNVVLRWNSALLQAVRNPRLSPLYTARALAITHTCMYDAWVAYDRGAVGTRLGDQKALEYFNGLADKTSYRIDVARGREHFTAGDAEDTEDRRRSLVISNQSGH